MSSLPVSAVAPRLMAMVLMRIGVSRSCGFSFGVGGESDVLDPAPDFAANALPGEGDHDRALKLLDQAALQQPRAKARARRRFHRRAAFLDPRQAQLVTVLQAPA